MKRIVWWSAVLATGVMVFTPAGEATHAYDGRPHWRSSTVEATVKVVDSVTSGWNAALRDGADDWSVSPDVNMTVSSSSTRKRKRKKCPYSTGAIHVCNYRYRNSWAGLAQFTFNGDGHILKARIRLNDARARSGDRAAIACHELGHTLGLGHYPNQQPPDSCMATPAGPEDPSAHDYTEVGVNHGHLDPMTLSGSGSGATSWESDPNVRVERDGDLTHVTWILPAR